MCFGDVFVFVRLCVDVFLSRVSEAGFAVSSNTFPVFIFRLII